MPPDLVPAAADLTPPADAAAAIDQARRRADAGALLTLAQEVEDAALADLARQAAVEALSRRGWTAAQQADILAAAARIDEPARPDPDPAPAAVSATPPTASTPPAAPAGPAPGHRCRVWLFSGHLMDAPGRHPPRFPPALEAAAITAIGQALDDGGARPGDTLYGQAAAGGDLICLEAALARGMAAEVLLPHDETTFIERSMLVSHDGPTWQRRWLAVRPRLAAPPRSLSGLGPAARNPYERANRWLLHSALAAGGARGVQVLALWDGVATGTEGGTWQVVAAAQRLHWPLRVVNTRVLTPAS